METSAFYFRPRIEGSVGVAALINAHVLLTICGMGEHHILSLIRLRVLLGQFRTWLLLFCLVVVDPRYMPLGF